ncbi:hypothetical protein VNO78_19414 [Psophocarpus tetragonolobus]|uniref:Uncharacterized protein n=1 Tax=Psophocarpus tetragonolobus TaxID=3891 RepID=A0AAN9XG76_PSOTE
MLNPLLVLLKKRGRKEEDKKEGERERKKLTAVQLKMKGFGVGCVRRKEDDDDVARHANTRSFQADTPSRELRTRLRRIT